MKKLSYYKKNNSINFRIKSCLFFFFTLLFHLTINAQTLTISSTGDNGPSSGTNWSISSNTLTVTGTANIRASVIANALTNGSLSIVGNTTTFNVTISESITATGNNTLTVASSTNTGTITVNSAISLSGAAIFNANTFELGNGINISTSSNSSITFNSNLNFTTSGTTRRTISSAGGDIIIHADKDANGSGVLDLDYLTLNPAAGNIIIRGETAAFNVGSTDGPYINGTGSFTFESSDASFGQTIYTTWFQLDQDNNGISGLTLGKIGNTANIEQNSNFTIAGPVNYYGGYVNITGTLTSSSGNILLKGISNNNTSVNISSGGITKSAGTGTLTMQGHGRTHNGGTISTSGTGVLNVIIWSDFDGDNVGGGSTNHGTISTNGGHVWMGGSSTNAGSYNWNGLAVGDGPSVGASGANANALDIFGPITTNGGDLLLWAGNGFGGSNGIVTNSGWQLNVGNGDIILVTDVILGTGPSLFFMQSGGSFTLVPNDGDFGATFNWDGTTNTVSGVGTGWNFGGNFNYLWLENPASLTSLTIGKYEGMLNGSTPVVLSNSSNVTFTNTTATSISGPISIYGGNITISQNLSSTLSGAAILLQANGFIDLSASRTIQSNNGNITLKANSGGSLTTNITAIDLNAGSQLLSTGGNITIGGGYSGSEGNVYAATNITNGGYAIVLETSTINAAGGHIRIYGNNVSSYGDGVFLDAVNISTTGNGTIGIYGDSYGGYNGTQYFGGITFENLASTIQTVNGNLTLKGILTNSQSTQGYAINFYRSPGSTGQTRHIQILSQTGNIQITADRGSSSGGGIGHSSWGHIYFGSPLNNSYTSTGSITFTYSGLVHAGANGFKVKTTGAVTYEPVANSFIATQTLPANTNYVLAENASSLTIGKTTNTANIILDASQTISGPIAVYGGNITINENLNTTSGNTSGNVLIKGSGDVILAASKSITTSGATVILWANSDNASSDGSIALRNGSSIVTGSSTVAGGHIWIGGGSNGTTWNGLAVGSGYAVPGTIFTPSNGGGNLQSGIYFERNSISSFGGNIKIAGDGAATSRGIVSYGNTVTINSGSGKIELDGQVTSSATGNRGGILFGLHDNTVISTVNISSSATSGDAITINGVGRGTEDAIALSGTLNITSSGGGNIVMNGNALGTGRSIVAGNYYHGIMNIFANSGNISLNGNTKAVQVATQIINGLTSGPSKLNIGQGGSITSSSSDVFITADNIALAANGIGIISTGKVTIEPSSNSFSNAITYPITNLSISNTITGLTLGKSTNTANITIANAQTIAGPISVYGGDIAINNNLTSTANNAKILIKASGQINTNDTRTFQTNNGDFILWSDADNNNGGRIWLGLNNTINTANGSTSSGLSGGGKIVLAGGLDNGANGGTANDGIPDGFASNSSSIGVYLGNASSNYTQMYSGGGDIFIKGASTFASSSNGGTGVWSEGRWLANSGKGTISIHGTSTHFYGINFSFPSSNISTGNKHIEFVSDKSTGNAVDITGLSNASYGVVFNYENPKEVLATGGGAISITGTGGGSVQGIFLQNTDILSTSGDITMNGGVNGIRVASSGVRIGSRSSSAITSSSSNIIWTANSLDLITLSSGFSNNFSTSGKVTIEPSSNSFTNAITYPITNLTLANTVSGLTIGKSTNTANITFGSATSIAGPITAYGGNININENINTASGGISGDILLKASGDIVLAASKSITTSSGDLIVWSNSDGATTNGSVLLRNQSSITTNGGHIWIGGGSGNTTWNSLTVGNGQAVSGTTFTTPVGTTTTYESGIYLEKTTINSGGGNVYLSGTSSGTDATLAFGILTHDVSSVNSGSGTITIKGGTGSNTVRGMVVGIRYSNQPGSLTLTSSSTQTTAIDIDCRSASNYGLTFEGTFDLISTQSGGISYTTIGSSATAGTRIGFSNNPGTLNILAASGNITVNTGSSGFEPTTTSNKAYFGAKSGTSVTSSSSNIRHITDDLTPSDGSMNFSSTGTLTIEPYGTTFASAFNTTLMTQTGLTGLTIGKSTNTANITFGSATSIAGPITAYGGTIAINENLSSSNGSTISLFGNSLTFGSTKTVTSANGQLVVAPQTASNSIGLGGASGTLSLPTSYFSTNFADGFSNIQIGSNSQTGAISSNAFTVRDNMTFLTTGSLTLGGIPVLGSNNVTLGSAISSITASTNGYFKTDGTGVVNRTIANGSNHLFPIGNALYNPVSIANNTGASDVFTAKVRDAVLKDGTSGTQMTDPLVNVTWDINKTNANASSGVDFTLQWNSSQEANSINSYRLNHYNNSTPEWEFAAGTSGSVSGSSTKTMTHTGYTGTFSPFAIGSGTTPLPVDLVSFDATPRNNSVDLTWTSFGDNKNPFNILKSNDGVNWKSIGTQVPNDNSVHYLFTDHQPAPVNYYQLSQIDNSNTLQYSDIRIVNLNSNKLVIFPNPNNGEFTIQSNHVVDFQVTDYTGKVILEGNNSNPLIKTNLTKGIYFIKITEGDKTTFSKLIVK
jgi:hypothetical protein